MTKKNAKRIYLDHAATTATDKEVIKAMMPYFSDISGNPSALHADGLKAKNALNAARENVAKILNVEPREIVFCGSGTESDNLAILGVARAYKKKPPLNLPLSKGENNAQLDGYDHLISINIEHHAVLNSLEHLEKEGYKLTVVPVEHNGIVDPEKIYKNIKTDTLLVSVMYANNEIGAIQPIEKIAELIKKWKQDNGRKPLDPPFFHTDACQAAGYLNLDVKKLGVDLMTLNGSKIYGPKGVGLLYVKQRVRLEPLIYGGGQEKGLRSGTENLASIVGFSKALEIARQNRKKESARLIKLRDYFFKKIIKEIPKTFINGDFKNRLPNNVNVSILDIEGEAALLYLDNKGISASTGSACDSARLEPSHVILAIGRPYEYAHGSLRFTLGKETTRIDITYTAAALKETVRKLRKISPLNIKIEDEKSFVDKKAFLGDGRPHWERRKV